MDSNIVKIKQLSIDETAQEANEEDSLKWGLPLAEVYKMAFKYYKGA